jgi:hypothetical protein
MIELLTSSVLSVACSIYKCVIAINFYYELGSSDTGNILSAKSENPVAALYVFTALSGTYIDPLKTSANPSVTVGGVSV